MPKWFRDGLLALYFRLHSFRRTAELCDERYVTIIESVPAVKVRLFCLDPSHLLREPLSRPLEGLNCAILFPALKLKGDRQSDGAIQAADSTKPVAWVAYGMKSSRTGFAPEESVSGCTAPPVGTGRGTVGVSLRSRRLMWPLRAISAERLLRIYAIVITFLSKHSSCPQ